MIKSIILSFLASISINSYAGINSVTIVQDTLMGAWNGNCLRYQPSMQACLWLSPLGVRSVTPLLDHYLPDLVVIVYRNHDDNPWDEAKMILDQSSHAIQKQFIPNVGSGNHSLLIEDQQIIFKESDVIGNPALMIFKEQSSQILLKSTATALKPYYQSMLDSALWRGFMPEALFEETAAVGLNFSHHIGTGINDWGGIYPHEGTVIGTDDLKASMVIAQRAADILTNSQVFGHLHQELPTSCGKHCHAARIKENSDDTLFQMIYPISQTECVPLGSNKSYSEKMLNAKGSYAWIVWRHYQGCPDGGGEFLGVI